jgi:hypothetical protein
MASADGRTDRDTADQAGQTEDLPDPHRWVL